MSGFLYPGAVGDEAPMRPELDTPLFSRPLSHQQMTGEVAQLREQVRSLLMERAQREDSTRHEALQLVTLTKSTAQLTKKIFDEVKHASEKFPSWPTDPLHASAVLDEEVGELKKAVLQCCYESHKSSPEEVRAEAVQTAAMSIRFLISLDKYNYQPSTQHLQFSTSG